MKNTQHTNSQGNNNGSDQSVHPGIFQGLVLASSQLKNEQKLSNMQYIIPNFLVLHFGEIFMKIGTKIAKLQVHENLHKNVNENMFSFTFLCKFSFD